MKEKCLEKLLDNFSLNTELAPKVSKKKYSNYFAVAVATFGH